MQITVFGPQTLPGGSWSAVRLSKSTKSPPTPATLPQPQARVAHRVKEFTSSDDPSTRMSAALRLPNACRRSSTGEPATVTVLGPLRTGMTAPPKGASSTPTGAFR